MIGINSFATRQTAESKFSHFGGSWEELQQLVEKHVRTATPGYRDGVQTVSVPAENFYCGVVEVTPETELRAVFASRRPPEKPYLQFEAVNGEKLPAKNVEVIIYRRDVLLEDGEDAVSTNCEWEVVSINARPTDEEEPQHPVSMARNFLNREGGTKADYSAEEFAKSIEYWSTRAMCGE